MFLVRIQNSIPQIRDFACWTEICIGIHDNYYRVATAQIVNV